MIDFFPPRTDTIQFSSTPSTPPSSEKLWKGSLGSLDLQSISSVSPKSKISIPQTPPSPNSVHNPRTPPTAKNSATKGETPQSLPETSSSETIKESIRKRKLRCTKVKEQLYIDFGQSSFGSRTICPVCNMLYVHGVVEDELNHRKICNDYANGVAFAMWKNIRIVHGSLLSSCFIVEIRPNDPVQHRRKVIQVKRIVDQEVGFLMSSRTSSLSQERDSESLRGKTVFLQILDKKVVGFCAVEVISEAFELIDAQVEEGAKKQKHCDEALTSLPKENRQQYYRSIKSSKAMMGVHQIWCHHSHRRKKIARTLVDTARSKLVYGMTVPFNMVAFSSPTAAGVSFAKRYSETDRPLIYDCL